MKFGSWVLYLFVILLCLTLVGLGGAGYLLYEQHQALQRLTKDTKRLRLSTQSLEALLAQSQGWSRLGQSRPIQPPPAAAPPRPAPKTTTTAAVAKLTTSTTSTTTSTTLPPPPSPAPAAAPQSQQNQTAPNQEEAPGTANGASSELGEDPTSSDWVSIRNVRQNKSGGGLTVRFEVANKNNGRGQAEGYVTVVLRGTRKGAPWVEAWPPARLSPLGRPENYRRGKAFAVRRYRTLKARFAIADKYLEQLEFVVYDRAGGLVMVRKVDVTIKQRKPRGR